ncbi:LAQU0S07e02674g1_1 [Lachancea quebecensis]|uniref:LAQU0S07e02674g1_1 n=1 Tax=Lachancea quebecensis TaxID=1654605 RepID=A0A0P1KSG5_9SACH|nr:LAQU0S07e02674g1_1 [Lachancea quebecensis]
MSQQLLPQAFLTNFHNRIRNENVPFFITAQPSRGHKRAKVVNYAEFETDLLEEFVEDDAKDLNGKEEENGKPAISAEELANENALPDLDSQDDPTNILKYPRIRETFLQSRIATPYKISISPQDATQPVPIIIPIRLNVEHNGHKIIDFFTWNLNDHSLTPEQFAAIYCQDLDFPVTSVVHSQISTSISEQLQEYSTLASVTVPDLHVIINLTCNLDSKMYEDNFEWDLNDQSLTPEQFANSVVQDLGLTREFAPAIAHALHESLLRVKKDWLEGHISPDQVANGAAFGYLSGIRLDVDALGVSWCPKVEVLSQWEIEKREIEKERNLRRLKRESAKVEDRSSRRSRKRRVDDLETTLRL